MRTGRRKPSRFSFENEFASAPAVPLKTRAFGNGVLNRPWLRPRSLQRLPFQKRLRCEISTNLRCGLLSKGSGLGQRIRDSLARSKSRLVLDLNKLHWNKTDDLRPLCEKLSAYRSRIRVVLPKLSATHPELLLIASMFHHY